MENIRAERIAAWSEYENAAEDMAKRGRKGTIGEPLPENMTPEAVQLIADDPEAFEARVKDYAYGLAMEHVELPRFTVCVSVGGVVQFYQLTRAEIDEAWRTIQASALPEARIGFYDLRDGWQQMSTGAKIRDRANRSPEYKEFITSII